MAKLPEGFQEDTVSGFQRHISYNVPNFTDHQLDLLVDYMKEVGATSEEELYRMNETELANLVGEEEAKLIMQYCKKTMEMSARRGSAKGEKVNGAKEPSDHRPEGPSASPPIPETQKNERNDEMSPMFQMFLDVYQSESMQNREVLKSIGSTIEVVTAKMQETVTIVSENMKKQFEKQDEVLKTLNQQAISMEKRQQETLTVTKQYMECMRDMNNASVLKLAEKVDKAMHINEVTNERLGKLLEKKNRSCVIQ